MSCLHSSTNFNTWSWMAMAEQNFLRIHDMFDAWEPDGSLSEAAGSLRISHAEIHEASREIHLTVISDAVMPDEEILGRIGRSIGDCYDIPPVTITPEAEEPVQELAGNGDQETENGFEEEEIPAPSEGDVPPDETDFIPDEETEKELIDRTGFEESGQPEDAAEEAFAETEILRREAMQGLNGKRVTPNTAYNRKEKVIYGHTIRKAVTPMKDINLDLRTVVVEGDVFAVDHRELTKRKATVIAFDMTDYTGSIHVKKFAESGECEMLLKNAAVGRHLKIQGRLDMDRFYNDIVLNPDSVCLCEKPVRKDTSQEKRVELHLHTTMSAMDALTKTGDAVRRAAEWGHRAIAITDHGVVQSFPDAMNAADGKDIKILYGVEAYYQNDVDERVAVHGDQDSVLGDGIVCFDIETTGLDNRKDVIIEIGAVLLKDGEIKDRFDTFVNPGRRLPQKIVELTGIRDDMLKDAPGQKEALIEFLNFVGNRPLSAHNAEFDTGFIAKECSEYGLDYHATVLDTLVLAQSLLSNLKNYKLDTIAQHLSLPQFHHHRASDDAATVAYMLIPFYKMLAEQHVYRMQEINPYIQSTGTASRKRTTYHLILIAKNQIGLRNLYKLVSLSNLKYFRRYPIMPKSEINRCREGLIIGSACAAGELYEAILRNRPQTELERIASWYDYLEIQPVCNNEFLLRENKVDSEDELYRINRRIVELGDKIGKPVCATGDVHFLDPKDEIYRHILLASKQFRDADAKLPIYFKSTNEMLDEFSYLGEEKAREVVITNTNLIADMCDVIRPLPQKLFAPKLENSAEELQKLVWDKAHELYGEDPPQIVKDRIELELPGIIKRHYDVIYMSAQKLVQNSLEHGYLVGSRGSVGSSIVAFLSGITEVNALPPHYRCPKCKHTDFETGKDYGCGADMPDAVCPVCGTKYVKDGFNIPFETFLGFGGKKMPDIDLNFSGLYQAKAHQYTFELFGRNHVFRAGTVGKVAQKTAYGYVKKYLEERDLHVSKAEENRLTIGCTDVKRTTGQHPGGMVVIPRDKEIYDFCPVQHPADDPHSGIITTHFEYHCMESNILKLDMLGHDDPTMIRMLQDLTGIDPRKVPLDDPDTMSIFSDSKVLGYSNDPILGPTGATAVPEFGTSFVRGMLVDTKPKDFDTLVRLSGFSHGTDVWLGNAKDLITSGVAAVNQTICCRDDIMLYLMKMGLDSQLAFNIMEDVRKGRVKKNGFKAGYEDIMHEHGVPDWYIESCRKIAYLFPKAHAVAYVMSAFRITWFKVHRPLAFYATYFTVRAKNVDESVMFRGMDICLNKIKEIKAKEKPSDAENDMLVTLEVCYEFYLRGYHFKPIDIYHSAATQYLIDEEENALIPPFVSVTGLGEAAAESIVQQREGREFISIEEVAQACPKLSKTHIDLLKAAGAFGSLPDSSQLSFF